MEELTSEKILRVSKELFPTGLKIELGTDATVEVDREGRGGTVTDEDPNNPPSKSLGGNTASLYCCKLARSRAGLADGI